MLSSQTSHNGRSVQECTIRQCHWTRSSNALHVCLDCDEEIYKHAISPTFTSFQAQEQVMESITWPELNSAYPAIPITSTGGVALITVNSSHESAILNQGEVLTLPNHGLKNRTKDPMLLSAVVYDRSYANPYANRDHFSSSDNFAAGEPRLHDNGVSGISIEAHVRKVGDRSSGMHDTLWFDTCFSYKAHEAALEVLDGEAALSDSSDIDKSSLDD